MTTNPARYSVLATTGQTTCRLVAFCDDSTDACRLLHDETQAWRMSGTLKRAIQRVSVGRSREPQRERAGRRDGPDQVAPVEGLVLLLAQQDDLAEVVEVAEEDGAADEAEDGKEGMLAEEGRDEVSRLKQRTN